MAQQDPEKFRDTARMTTVNSGLLESYSYLLVEKGNEMIFVGNQFHYNSIQKQIPDVGGFELAYDGGVYVGEFCADGRVHGVGIWDYPDGSRYEGEFFEGYQQGWGVLIQPDGTRREGWFEKDEYVGPEKPLEKKET
jgi:hypothetical protein